MQNEINGLFQKKMDRLTFLKHVGVGVVALTGVSALLKTMSSLGGTSRETATLGYGASAYGGKPLSR